MYFAYILVCTPSFSASSRVSEAQSDVRGYPEIFDLIHQPGCKLLTCVGVPLVPDIMIIDAKGVPVRKVQRAVEATESR